ncbi:MAG: extracellular solute-binding protein, partial [Bifidobacteriaceae bacterium]|nr:extracellular solute-binding protein [Bifidobacteriaceae bacterium]
MKKTIITLSTFALLFMGGLAITGCSGGDEDAANQEKASPCETDANTLTVSADITSNPGYEKYYEFAKSKFESENPGVTVNVVKMAQQDQIDKLSTDGPACKGPDVTIMPYNDAAVQISKKNVMPYGESLQGVDNSVVERTTVDGQTTGQPLSVESNILYYNKSLIPEAPKTMDELYKLTENSKFAFANDPSKSVAFLADWSNFYNSFPVFGGYGAYIFGETDGKDNPDDIGLASDDAVKAAEYMKTWYDKWPQDMKGKNASPIEQDQFTKGKAGAVIDGPWNSTMYKKALGDDLGETLLPTLPNGKQMQAFNGGKEWVVSQYAVNPRLAKAWLKIVGDE